MMRLIVILILSFGVMLNACQAPGKVNTVGDSTDARKLVGEYDNSRNSLDWTGTYTGNLPCADCEGVETIIELKRDLTYFSQMIYKGKSEKVIKSKGTFSWDVNGNKIILVNDNGQISSMYQVGENKLIQLDMVGNKITGDLSGRYILGKTIPGLVEKYWKLTELMGKQVQINGTGKEPHLTLKADGNRVIGSGGCNSFTGSYQLTGASHISFSKIASTQMACLNMEYESQFLKILEQVDNYSLVGDTSLVLNRAKMAPLARFKVVY